MQAFTDLHPKPSPIHGSVKDIFMETFEELVKVVEAVTYAVGGIVSEKIRSAFIRMAYNEKQIYMRISTHSKTYIVFLIPKTLDTIYQ